MDTNRNKHITQVEGCYEVGHFLEYKLSFWDTGETCWKEVQFNDLDFGSQTAENRQIQALYFTWKHVSIYP